MPWSTHNALIGGDLNDDNEVNTLDYALRRQNWMGFSPAQLAAADINGDISSMVTTTPSFKPGGTNKETPNRRQVPLKENEDAKFREHSERDRKQYG